MLFLNNSINNLYKNIKEIKKDKEKLIFYRLNSIQKDKTFIENIIK